MDLRKPQDYFQRVWATAFRASDLAATAGPNTTTRSEDDDAEEACA